VPHYLSSECTRSCKKQKRTEGSYIPSSTIYEKTGFFEKPAFINSNDKRILDGLHTGKACLN